MFTCHIFFLNFLLLFFVSFLEKDSGLFTIYQYHFCHICNVLCFADVIFRDCICLLVALYAVVVSEYESIYYRIS